MLTEKIGVPAMLEQLAEESAELTQAALKKARYLRGENPVYSPLEKIEENLEEEIADVLICIEEALENSIALVNKVDDMRAMKVRRMKKRCKEMEKRHVQKG